MIPWGWVNLAAALPAFALVAARISGLFLGAPLFSSRLIPGRLKVAVALTISAAVFPALWHTLPQDMGVAALIIGMVGELVIGLAIGMGLNLIMMATQMAGMIVGQQAGLSLAAQFNPTSEMQSTVIGEIFFFAAMTIFLVLGGHRQMVRALLDSFEKIPVMTFQAGPEVLDLLVLLLMSSLTLAMKIAGPAVMALLLAKASLGFLSRTMPQLHILSVGFALFVTLGVGMCGLTMSGYDEILVAYFSEALAQVRATFGLD